MQEETAAELKDTKTKLLKELKGVKVQKDYKIELTKSGTKTLKVAHEGNYIYYHSKYNPLNEAKSILKTECNYDLAGEHPDVIVIGGFGLGYISNAAYNEFKESDIIICDYDKEVVKLSFCEMSHNALLKDSRVEFLINDNIQVLKELLSSKRTTKIKGIIHKPSEKLNPGYYKELKQIIEDIINAKQINKATTNRFEKVWSKNLLKNLKEFVLNKGIESLRGAYKGYGCILVGAGPSLIKNINHLKGLKGKALIIAVDTVLQILLKHDIEPDFVVAVDPQDINKKYFENTSYSKSVLICDPTISPKIIRRHKKKLMLGSMFYLIQYIESLTEAKGRIEIGGSVATAAYSTAQILGVDPIILIGLDLAYTDEVTHMQGAYFEENWIYTQTKLKNALTLSQEHINKLSHFRVRGYYEGTYVRSDRRFEMYRTWFENQFNKANNVVVDATEGGSYKRYCQRLSLTEAIKKYINTSKKNINFTKNLNLRVEDGLLYLKRVEIALNDLIYLYYEMGKEIRKGTRLADDLYKTVLKGIKYKKDVSKRVVDINKELLDIEEKVISQKAMNDFLSLSMQRVINEIGDGDELAKESEAANNNAADSTLKSNDLKIAKETKLIYEEIENSLNFNLKYLRNAHKEILNYINVNSL